MKGNDAAKTAYYTGPIKVMTVPRGVSLPARASSYDLPTVEAQ